LLWITKQSFNKAKGKNEIRDVRFGNEQQLRRSLKTHHKLLPFALCLLPLRNTPKGVGNYCLGAILKPLFSLHNCLVIQRGESMNILIVEDSPLVCRMIRSLVAPFAAEVFECDEADVAFSTYQKYHPDWVLMDIRLKQSDGIAATKQICDSDPKARVVIVTNYDDVSLRAAATDAGACAYVLKDNLYTLPSFLNRQTKG
jgi:CheY-like chemotaxis protein